MPKKTEKKVPVGPLTTTEKVANTKYKKDFAESAGRPISKPPPKKKPKKKKKKVKRSEALKKGPGVEERHHTVIISANEFGPITHAPKTKAVRVAASLPRKARTKAQPLKSQRSKVKSARKEGRKGVTSAIQTSSSRFDAAPKIGRAVKTTMDKTGRSAQLRARLKRRTGVKQAVKKSSSRFDATPKIKTAQSQFTTTSQKRKRKLRDRK